MYILWWMEGTRITGLGIRSVVSFSRGIVTLPLLEDGVLGRQQMCTNVHFASVPRTALSTLIPVTCHLDIPPILLELNVSVKEKGRARKVGSDSRSPRRHQRLTRLQAPRMKLTPGQPQAGVSRLTVVFLCPRYRLKTRMSRLPAPRLKLTPGMPHVGVCRLTVVIVRAFVVVSKRG